VRRDHTTWRRFLRTQASTILASDFFHVDCALTPQRLYVFRNLLMDLGERVNQFRFLIRDRAGQFTDTCDAVPTDASVTVCKIPPRSPRANAYAERFVPIARSEVTDRMLIFSEGHLRRTLDEYARHYNARRPHRALQLQPRRSDRPVVDLTHQCVRRGRYAARPA
jgi:putative transposase